MSKDTNDKWKLENWDLESVDGSENQHAAEPDAFEEYDEDPLLDAIENLDDDELDNAPRYEWAGILGRFVALLALIAFLGVFLVPSVVSFVQATLIVPSSPDYIDLVTPGTLGARFARGDIKYTIVFPDNFPDSQKNFYLEPVYNAMAEWENALDSIVDFVPAGPGEIDDLLITFVFDLDTAGVASMRPAEVYRTQLAIKLYTDSAMPEKAYIGTVALHELGHTLGLWGHSDYSGDAMYPIAGRIFPSKRDINTIRKIYGLGPR
ncbi:MAG TPA: matrixin family metalloprotease [bacterium]|jgi:hypothetical protein